MSNARGWNPRFHARKLGKVFLVGVLGMGRRTSIWRLTAGALMAVGLSLASTSSHAVSSYLTAFNALYLTSTTGTTAWSTSSGRCNVCHSSGGGTALNPFGRAFALQTTHSSNPTGALQAIAGVNSDGDTGAASNLTEINANAQPGWRSGPNNTLYVVTSPNTVSATGQNPPTTLVGAADPAATTTTTTTTTTAPPTTTTTTAAPTTTTTTAGATSTTSAATSTTTTAAPTTTTTTAAPTTTTTTTARPTTTTTASTTTTTLSLNGAALYTTNCSSCHGPLATSQVRGASASTISSFISSTSSMRNSILSTNGGVPLTSAQIQAIANALASTTTTTTAAGTTTTTTVGTTTTTTLPPPPVVSTTNRIASHNRDSSGYKENCLDCHSGVLTEAPVVANATVTNPRLLGQPVTLTAHGTYLRGNFKPGLSGADTQCQFCHRSVSIVEGPPMPQNEMDGSIRKRVDPAVCTLCHGPTTGGQPNSPGPQFYQVGLPQLVPLTNTLVAGRKLYGMFCAGCHNPLAKSEVVGNSATTIQGMIAVNMGGMGPLRVLTQGQINAIATALGGATSSTEEHDD